MDFKHLSLPLIFEGEPRLYGGGSPNPETIRNKGNRTEHYNKINRQSQYIIDYWKEKRELRNKEGLPPIPKNIPVLLRIDDTDIDIDYLRSTFDFEVISEVEDGYVIITSEDIDMSIFMNKLNEFTQNIHGSGRVSQIHEICTNEDRINYILSDSLKRIWTNLSDNQEYIVDVSIECIGKVVIKKFPEEKKYKTEEGYLRAVKRWEEKRDEAYIAWDDLQFDRLQEVYNFVTEYNGQVLSSESEDYMQLMQLPDSFTVRIKINGKGLRDLTYNYPYVFEINEPDTICLPIYITSNQVLDVEDLDFISPDANSSKICIIDSGIQERHKYLSDAIDEAHSKSYLRGVNDISDNVENGGHGTRVAGAVLYPRGVPVEGRYKFHCWIQNARVLDDNNSLPEYLFPPKLLSIIVEDYNGTYGTRIFNHSISSAYPCRTSRMSTWAAQIDNLSHNNDILFMQSAGNINIRYDNPNIKGVEEFINEGAEYPHYLLEKTCRLRNPAQSFQALTVGSICIDELNDGFKKSFGNKDFPSAFSATGTGIWGSIKPDVVEYGGDYAYDTGMSISIPTEVCPELIRKSPEGPAFDKDSVGTSFSTPKVSSIAAVLGNMFPEESCLLYRALIAGAARWPSWAMNTDREDYKNVLRHIGYGMPDLERAIENNNYKVTLFTKGNRELGARQTHIFEVPIPEEIRRVGEDYNILIEITLSYSAQPRRTRKNPRKYLSVWLDWDCSKIGELPGDFIERINKHSQYENAGDSNPFKWIIGRQSTHGLSRDIARNIGTLQKDWCVIKAHELTDGFCVAVIGHPGWSNDIDHKANYSLVVSFEAINKDIEIYNTIRSQVEVETQVEIQI